MISVCIATYNGEKYIKDQLQSILSQISSEDEVVISDDGSTDATIDVVKSMNDSRIRLVNSQFRNPIRNFEKALALATGDYIFLADQDDIWCDGKVAEVYAALQKYDMVVTDCTVVDDNLNVLYPSFFAENNSGKGLIKNIVKNSYLGCCMAFKKEVLAVALPFPPDIPMHDIWLGLVSDLFYKSTFIGNQLILYRRHDKNASVTGGKSPFSLWQKFMFRWRVVKYVPRLVLRKTFQKV